MPRVAKATKAAGSAPAKPAARKKNAYVKSEKIPLGEILRDLSGQEWKIGPSIGSGGFGDIYCACKADGNARKDVKDYDCVIKIEPHGNGPLFVEMHFYMRNARLDDIKAFCSKHKIKSLGIPHIIGSGSHVLNGEKHRFLVIPRYGKDVWSFFLANEKQLPRHTIYRLAIQMLDVYEYIHGSTYVHADLKGANILLDYTGKNPAQAFLVDFGLACKHTTSDYKPDPRKMHNGTIEYTSRDAHNGVPTRRGDFEILGYNLIHWSGVALPWETQKLLTNPQKVQKSKEEFMKDVTGSLNKLFNKDPPSPIKQYMEYVQSMEYNQTPDYGKCRKLFEAGLKSLNKTNSGPLEMTFLKSPVKPKVQSKRPAEIEESSSESEEQSTPIRSPLRLRSSATPSKRLCSADVESRSPAQRKIKNNRSPPLAAATTPSKNGSARLRQNATPRLNISSTSKTSSPLPQKPGKTIINDNITPNPRSKKTYEFNFELDVSLDANVIVNVKRKKKAPAPETTPKAAANKSDESKENKSMGDSDSEVPPSPTDSPIPRVSVRKVRPDLKSPSPSPHVTARRVK